MRAPQVVPLAGMPRQVSVFEVGPRDGLQNEPTLVPVATKAQFVRRLVSAGLAAIETTSFVHPGRVPQLADADELLHELGPLPGLRTVVLVPNLRGLDRALAAGATEVAVFISATESFSQNNLGCSRAQALRVTQQVCARALDAGLAVRGYVSMCFGDPWEGSVPVGQVVEAVQALLAQGCTQISLGDTVGVATTGQVVELLRELDAVGVPASRLAVHFHDTYGQALANSLTAVQHGVWTVDASAGGLGGCPFAASATGNLATEDLVWALHGMGVDTGIDLPALVQTSGWLAAQLGRPSPSRVVRALTSG